MPRRALFVAAALALMIAVAAAVQALREERSWRADAETAAGARPIAAGPAPTTSAPQPAPAPPPAAGMATRRSLAIAWRDHDGNAWRTRIAIEGDKAEVATTQADGPQVVQYRARVVRGADSVRIDATDAEPSGPAAAQWLPDSFTIAADGSVEVSDGRHPPGSGYLAQESGWKR